MPHVHIDSRPICAGVPDHIREALVGLTVPLREEVTWRTKTQKTYILSTVDVMKALESAMSEKAITAYRWFRDHEHTRQTITVGSAFCTFHP